MRGLIFTTASRDTEKMITSFTHLYPNTEVVQYDVPGRNMVAIAESIKPDIIIWIGAHRGSHHLEGIRPVPTAEELALVGKVAPMMHFCPDSGDTPWWSDIEGFERTGAFQLQVGIDGCHNSPISRIGMVTLTPIDPAYFPDVPWEQKDIGCGFAGGGGCREPMTNSLQQKKLLTKFTDGAYSDMCKFYSRCKLVWNDARTGTGTKRHVKGRFIEAALGGAIPIEPFDSPAYDWFKPNEEYLVWQTEADVENHIRAIPERDEQYKAMAANLKKRMIEEHSNKVFWDKVLTRMGLSNGRAIGEDASN